MLSTPQGKANIRGSPRGESSAQIQVQQWDMPPPVTLISGERGGGAAGRTSVGLMAVVGYIFHDKGPPKCLGYQPHREHTGKRTDQALHSYPFTGLRTP